MRPHSLSGLAARGRALTECRRGNVAVIFSLTLLPTLFLAGAAVDYSNASNLKAKLQRATDGTNLQLCQIGGNPTQAQLQTAAQAYMAGYMTEKPFIIDSVTPLTNPRGVSMETRAVYQTAIVRAVNSNFASMTVRASASCSNQQQSFEIALVLDNTGSMNNSGGGTSKIQALRTAATNFVNSVFADPSMSSTTKISIVPFAAAVNVGTSFKTASWVDDKGKAAHHWNFVQGGAAIAAAYASYGIKSRFDVFNYIKSVQPSWDWTGCFESLPYPLNTRDGAPVSSNKESYYVPMFAPDESGNGGELQHADGGGTQVYSANSYIDDTNGYCSPTTDEAARTGQACKYMAPTNARTASVTPFAGLPIGPNNYCTTRALTRLTTSQTALTTEISLLTANGTTNIHEGFMWGWRTVSPLSVLANGVAYNTPYNNKIIVLMTDGANTWTANTGNYLKSVYSAYGHFRNPDGTTANTRIPAANANPTTDANGRAAIDALLLESCQNARTAGVVIYTIGFTVSGDPIDQQGIDLLSACSGNASRSYVATDASSINDVFQQVAYSIGRLRLSR